MSILKALEQNLITDELKEYAYIHEAHKIALPPESTILLGTGIASKNSPSIGIGYEYLGFAFLAKQLQEILKAKRVEQSVSTTGYPIITFDIICDIQKLILNQNDFYERFIEHIDSVSFALK